MGGKPNRALTFVAIGLAGGGAVYLWMINLAILRDRDQDRIDELQLELLATRDALRQSEGDFAFLDGATLFPMKPAAKRVAGIVLCRGSTIFVTASHLPAAPKGKAYALWAYFEGKPMPAGEFQCGPDGTLRGRHTLTRDLAKVEGFVLTLEAADGAVAPAGPVFLTRP